MEARRTVIALLGGPGAGKGTQAAAIADWLKIPHISTGQLLRSEVAAASELGLRIKSRIDAGELIDDTTVNALLARRIAEPDCSTGFILDGYPRDREQAGALKAMLPGSDRLVVIDIQTDLERIVPRLTGRRTCKTCNRIYHLATSPPRHEGICDHCGDLLMQRSDDRENVIRERFGNYSRMTKPLTELYKGWHVYHRVDGMQSPEKVAATVQRLLDSIIHPHHAARAA